MFVAGRLATATLIAAGVLFASTTLRAQSSAPRTRLSGTLSDRSGALLAGAVIRVHSLDSDRSWTIHTDAHGRYVLNDVAAGSYTLTIRQGGFSELAKTIIVGKESSLEVPLVLSVASVVQRVEVTADAVDTGFTARQIRESSARDLGEAVEDLPGVEKVRKAGIANDIAIRGLFHDNLATTFDGARLYGACTGQMDPPAYHVDLAEVDHVDIVKGPFDVTTQGALGGYVKVITRIPEAQSLAFQSNISTGSYGFYNPSATVSAGSQTVHFLSGYSYRTSEFYRDGNGNKVSTLGSYRNNSQDLQAFRAQSGWLRLALEPRKGQRGEIAYTRQQSGNLLYPYMMMDGIFDNADRFTLRYDLSQPAPWLHGMHAMGYATKVNHLMDNRLRSSAGSLPVSMSAQVVTFTDGVRLDADLPQEITVGYEFYRRYWDSNGFMKMTMMGKQMTTYSNTLPDVTEQVHGFYAAYRHAFGPRLLLTTGVRFDHSFSEAEKANPNLYLAYHGTTLMSTDDSGWSGNGKLSWQATTKTSFFAGVGSNIRFADPQERFFRSDASMGTGWVGNPLLTHPRNTEYDLGSTVKGSRVQLSSLVFFSKLDNAITLYGATREQAVSGVSSMAAQSYANVQAHQWGSEVSGQAELARGLTANGSFTYTRGSKVPQPQNNIRSSNLFQVPPARAQLGLRYERRGLYSGVSAVVTGRQDHVDTDERELATAGYSVFHLKAGYNRSRVRVEGGVNNLLARQYSDFLSYARNPYTNGVRLPEPGRNFFVNLAFTTTGSH